MEPWRQPIDFNIYGSRRGNYARDDCAARLPNIRLRNLLAPGTEGGVRNISPPRNHESLRCPR